MTDTFLLRLKKFSKVSATALISEDGYFYIFGDCPHDSLYIDGLMRRKQVKPKVLELRVARGRIAGAVPSNNFNLLNSKRILVNQIRQGTFEGSFTISPEFLAELRQLVKHSKSTHIQFESDGETAAAHAFDIVSIHGRSAWRNSYLDGLIGVPLSNAKGSFCFSCRTDALLALPDESATVGIYTSGLMRLVYSRDGVRVTLRDQEIRKPFTRFWSELSKRQVNFLFHPNR